MIKLKENNWYMVDIWNNELVRDYKVCELDSRKIYEVTYNKGTDKERKDLVRVVGQELRGVECISILKNECVDIVADFIDLYKNGCVKETDYILKRFRSQLVFE